METKTINISCFDINGEYLNEAPQDQTKNFLNLESPSRIISQYITENFVQNLSKSETDDKFVTKFTFSQNIEKKILITINCDVINNFSVSHQGTFDSNGYLIQYTELIPAESGSAKVEFTVSSSTKPNAAKQMSNLLGSITADGSSKSLSIDGVAKTVSNKGGTIYVGDVTLEKYVAGTSSTSTAVTVAFDTTTKNIFDAVTFAGSGTYNYTIKVGDVEFSNIHVANGVASFTAGGKTVQGTADNGKFKAVGNVVETEWVQSLINAGVLSTTEVVYE